MANVDWHNLYIVGAPWLEVRLPTAVWLGDLNAAFFLSRERSCHSHLTVWLGRQAPPSGGWAGEELERVCFCRYGTVYGTVRDGTVGYSVTSRLDMMRCDAGLCTGLCGTERLVVL